MFSLIETAKENGLDPYRYLTWLLNEAPKLAVTDADWAASLAPQMDLSLAAMDAALSLASFLFLW